jgi:hypothetical protein
MEKKWLATLTLVFLVTLAACQNAASTQAPMPAPAATSAPAAYDSATGGKNAAVGAAQPASATQMVIKNADLEIVVDDPGAGMTTIAKMANEMGGYVVTSKMYKTTTEGGIEVPRANITVRVPAEKLDDALAKIRALTRDPAKDVRSENVTGKDVTGDFVDLQSQLTNLENTEKQLQKIMDSATKTDDVLAVFSQLSSVRQKIEQIKGQMKYYQESTSLSAVVVQLLSKESVAPLTIGGWEPAGIARDAIQALIDVGKFLVELLIWLVIFILPLGLIFFFPGRMILRKIRKWQQSHPKTNTPVYPQMPFSGQPPPYPQAGQPPYNQPP